MKLSIDTADNLKTKVEIGDLEVVENYQYPQQQRVLEVIEKALRKKRVELQEITEIEVNLGPGSFTGLRVGCAIANTLAWILKIPINGKKIGVLAEPKYT